MPQINAMLEHPLTNDVQKLSEKAILTDLRNKKLKNLIALKIDEAYYAAKDPEEVVAQQVAATNPDGSPMSYNGITAKKFLADTRNKIAFVSEIITIIDSIYDQRDNH